MPQTDSGFDWKRLDAAHANWLGIDGKQKKPITEQTARLIASLWSQDDTPAIRAFAVSGHFVKEEIEAEIKACRENTGPATYDTDQDEMDTLTMLSEYVAPQEPRRTPQRASLTLRTLYAKYIEEGDYVDFHDDGTTLERVAFTALQDDGDGEFARITLDKGTKLLFAWEDVVTVWTDRTGRDGAALPGEQVSVRNTTRPDGRVVV